MSNLILFWHRRDLRISDNIGLTQASQQNQKVVGIFCLDQNILKRDDIAPVRITYMIGCLQHLQKRYQEIGSQLLILSGKPAEAIPKLATFLEAKAVYWNRDVEPYSRERDRQVTENLETVNIQVKTFWDQLLHCPEEIFTSTNKPYSVYTPFWRTWSGKKKSNPVNTPLLKGLTEEQLQQTKKVGVIDLPTAKELGFNWENPLILEPGETITLEKLETFCQAAIYSYQQQRNFPSIDGTSQLSPALKFGAIGIRTVWAKTQELIENCSSDEAFENIETWQKEIAWREFYQYVMYHYPELETGPYRPHWKNFPWENNEAYFLAWCEGRTGYPIVDAAMRQLNETGWMHNRCRMIVASFLTKDLIINWQWGEKYFMQKLIDGDLCANNGGWQWSASSGMDPKPLRIFNPASQTQKYDPEAEYIREWVSELRSVDLKYLVTGKIPADEREAVNYPTPIVDHKKRQQLFKSLYQEQKN
ncbi:MAG: deoxyribodipyrimidine photo-lyase, 8-HDF type [Okeania sp. SIO2C2]|uniref:deoxyribodipyrimidine photo-lyase, 8-HDF type n=1 Tax=Okeania sp. SIO2C2 TaxID=2607787 RepID=UPI0013BA1E87|nr:deoxyribodipyrimidine photo-lyase, 8-HDF type [Okeania sp. SIO2C2]NEP87499.1 deoxyribodipyrimidine photo-lyase, 8-HDF type [Okeania sp. SIO2C2]